jgi:hypothetical protein
MIASLSKILCAPVRCVNATKVSICSLGVFFNRWKCQQPYGPMWPWILWRHCLR